MKMKSIYSALWLLAIVGLASACSEESMPSKSEVTTQGAGRTVTFELKAEDLRAIEFGLGEKGPELKMTEENVKSVVVVSNKEMNDIRYGEIVWKKTNGVNHLYYKGKIKDLSTGRDLSLTDGDWYIMGYLGGAYNKETKRVEYDPNGTTLQAFLPEKRIAKPVPIYFPWTKLQVKTLGSESFGQTTFMAQTEKEIRFRALGLLMRVELKNEMAYDAHYKSIRYQSNALTTTKGYYNLDKGGLPKIPNDVDVDTPEPATWVTQEAEPDYTFVSEDAVTTKLDVTLSKGETYGKTFLVWAAPRKSESLADARPVTHVLANVERLVGGVARDIPKMKSIYIWGSNQKPVEGTKVIQRTRLVREKLALEYFDLGYLKVSDPRITAGRQYVSQSVPAYSGSVAYYDYDTYSASDFIVANSRAEWKVPKGLDAAGLFMPGGISFIPNALVSRERTVRIAGKESKYVDIYQPGTTTVYALRLDDSKTSLDPRKQYTAWRYTYSDMRGAKIECVYLGPAYKGDLVDIQQNSFWQLHSLDVITREYPNASLIDKYNGAIKNWPAIIATLEESASIGKQLKWVVGYMNDSGTRSMDAVYYYDKNDPDRKTLPSYVPVTLMHTDDRDWK